MNVQWNPRWRRAWWVASAVGTALFIGLDWLLRAWTGQSPLAPTATGLWLSVGVGMILGLAGILHERYLLRYKRTFLLAFYRAPLPERLQWKYQGPNLLINGWFTLAILALIAWCYFTHVFVLPALFALNAVFFLGNRHAAQVFNAELEQHPEDASQETN